MKLSSHHQMGVTSAVGAGKPKLLDQVRARMRRLGMARRSEEAYTGWIRRFILANDTRHPLEMGAAEVERFLTTLASRMSFGRLLVAVANKHARQLWAMLARGEACDPHAWIKHPMAQRNKATRAAA